MVNSALVTHEVLENAHRKVDRTVVPDLAFYLVTSPPTIEHVCEPNSAVCFASVELERRSVSTLCVALTLGLGGSACVGVALVAHSSIPFENVEHLHCVSALATHDVRSPVA